MPTKTTAVPRTRLVLEYFSNSAWNAIAQEAATEAKAAHDSALQQMANQRAAAATDLQKVKDRLTEREMSLKAINTALADTPANVLKKMNTLKKQKQEEADARRQSSPR